MPTANGVKRMARISPDLLLDRLPGPELVATYLDALGQLASGYKRSFSEAMLAKTRSAGTSDLISTSPEAPNRQSRYDLLKQWSETFPDLVYDYEPLTQADIARLNALMNGISRLLSKILPDLKAIDVQETRKSLSPDEQAQRISEILTRAGVAPEALAGLKSHITGAPPAPTPRTH